MRRKLGIIIAGSIISVGICVFAIYHISVCKRDVTNLYLNVDENLSENLTGQWFEENKNKYFLNMAGERVTGEQLIDNQVYCFDKNGVWNEEPPTPAAIISVQMSNEKTAYVSITGGKSWMSGESPKCYMDSGAYIFPKSIGEISITIHNNSDSKLLTGTGFRLLVWDENNWTAAAADGLHHTDEGYYVFPGDTLEMKCSFQEKPLDSGRYKLIKEAQQIGNNNGNVVFSLEFDLE